MQLTQKQQEGLEIAVQRYKDRKAPLYLYSWVCWGWKKYTC